MPVKLQIGYIDIRVFSHATEDVEKVLSAVKKTLPPEVAEKVVFKEDTLKGHYRNPIVLLKTRIGKRSYAQTVFEKLASDLGSLDKELLDREVRQHLENGNLYIRLDKQAAYLNKVKLRSDDPIHFRIHFRKSSEKEVMEICREAGMLL